MLRMIALVLLFSTTPLYAQSMVTTSWYGKEFAGRKTASGKIFNPLALTAAHPFLPFGTILQLFNPRAGRGVRVMVTDRGPYVRGRQLDVSHAAAKSLGFAQNGTIRLRMEVLR